MCEVHPTRVMKAWAVAEPGSQASWTVELEVLLGLRSRCLNCCLLLRLPMSLLARVSWSLVWVSGRFGVCLRRIVALLRRVVPL